MNQACAIIVERDDPHLYATALFAPEPARSRLMVLYAFDCELSRATRASKESLIPRMRLQWWRDMIAEAEACKPPKAHEVAAPLNELIVKGLVDPVDLDSLAQAREAELARPMDADQYFLWHKSRFNPLIRVAARILSEPASTRDLRDPPLVSHALSAAFVIGNAPAMARAGEAPLHEQLIGDGWASLARGTLNAETQAFLSQLAKQGMDELACARAEAKHLDPRVNPALLPLGRAERILQMASNPDFTLGDLDGIDRPFDGLKLAWRALRGRW